MRPGPISIVLVARIAERHAVEFAGRVALKAERDQAACEACQRGCEKTAEQRSVLRTDDIVVAERGIEILGFVRIPKA